MSIARACAAIWKRPFSSSGRSQGSQPLDGSAPSQVTHFTEHEIFDFSVSHDGRWIALSRGTRSSDVVLIKNAIPVSP